MRYFLVFCVLLFLVGCVSTGVPVMCPSRDAVVSITVDGKSVPVRIEAGSFDGEYLTVDEYQRIIEERKKGGVRFQPK